MALGFGGQGLCLRASVMVKKQKNFGMKILFNSVYIYIYVYNYIIDLLFIAVKFAE